MSNTPRTDIEAMPARQWGDKVELVPADLARELERELAAMRLLAAEPHYIDRVKEALGPLSLWDQKGLEAHVEAKVKEALSSPPEAVRRDTARMDWLETMTVNVRQPGRYGSFNVFWASPQENDGEETPSDLRRVIDAQMSKATPQKER